MFEIRNSLVDISPEAAIDLVDRIAVTRPVPRREYDQIYIKGSYLVEQAAFMRGRLEGRRILFLGDADGMALALASLNRPWGIGIKGTAVLDFDERVLSSHRGFMDGFDCGCRFKTRLYNIIDPVPADMRGRFDFFYINPPYGSKNDGMSIVLWLRRCLELCGGKVSGCIVMPWEDCDGEPWVAVVRHTMKEALEDFGLGVDCLGPAQAYHLPDAPTLSSRAIVVSASSNPLAATESKAYTFNQAKRLYGDPRPLPRYIYADSLNPLGVESSLVFSDEGWCTADGK